MVVVLVTNDVQGKYNTRLAHNWHTNELALPWECVDELDEVCEGKWGWFFDETLVLTFENKYDLVQSRFTIELT